MKSIKKLFGLLLAAAALTFAFVACSDDDDDDDNVVATFVTPEFEDSDGETGKYTITFYDDKTYVVHYDAHEEDDGFTTYWNMTAEKGKYEGAPAKDGDVKTTATSKIDDSAETEAAAVALVEAAAEKGSKSFTFTNKHFPLKDIDASDQKTETKTITDGKVEIDEDKDGNAVYATRK